MQVAGVLLGGGKSSRFGSNKLLATLDGKRLIDIACENFLEAGLEPVVFCGTDRPADSRVLVVEPGETMIETLRNGLRAIPDMPFAFAPADMPRLSPELVGRLMDAFMDSGMGFLLPVRRGRRGHPAFAFDKTPFFSCGDTDGPREVWRDAGDDLMQFEVDTEDIFLDVDTPEDLANL